MRLWFVAAGSSFFLSVGVKMLIETLSPSPFFIFGSWFGVEYAQNAGIAFGVVLPPFIQGVLIGVAFLTVLLFSVRLQHPLPCVGVGMIVGGAGANVLDRFTDGTVMDFILLWPFPLFNVADVCITFGAFLLVLGEFLLKNNTKTLAVVLGKW